MTALMNCGFDVIFLNMLNNYILEKWETKSNRLVLTAFAGALYNMFRLWSASGYKEDKEELVSSLVTIYNRPSRRRSASGHGKGSGCSIRKAYQYRLMVYDLQIAAINAPAVWVVFL